MHLNYLVRRLKFRVSTDGLPRTIKDLVYFNREIMLVEKEIGSYEIPVLDKDLHFNIINIKNSKITEKKFSIPLFHHYACNNCETLIAEKDHTCLGFVRWTRDNQFWDLKRLGIELQADEVYMFDLFILPEHRGSSIVKDLPAAAIHHLKSNGVSKFYGYYFLDNLQALWWHRAILRAHDLKKIKVHRLVFIDFINGKFFL